MVIKVNFAPQNFTEADGFILDSGEGYSADRGYGWVTQSSLDEGNPISIDLGNNTRDREANGNSTEDTLIHLQYPTSLVSPIAATSIKTPSAWEYDIANGAYLVTVGVGDPSFTDSNHVINVEGESAISGFVPTEDNLFAENTVLVEVNDGKLTVDAVGGFNTKLTSIEITAADNEETPINSGDTDGDSGDGESQITVGDFSIGFDASRISENKSGFFVADNEDTGAILFDISNPETLVVENDRLELSNANLLLSPEFATALGDASLQGTDVGDTRIDAIISDRGDGTFALESGTTSVFLDLPLLESAAGFQLAGVDSQAEPFSEQFQVGFAITEATDFTFQFQQENFVPLGGEIEHDGTVTFNTESEGNEGGEEIPIDSGENEENNGDGDGGDGAIAEETIKINFTPATAISADEYIQDIGGEYNEARGYGWITQESVDSDNPIPINISPNTRDRNSIEEETFDSLIHLQYADSFDNQNSIRTPAAWEYELANGEYTVTVSVGDPDFTDSNHVINIEGNTIISGFVPTEDNLFAVKTANVEVTDGKLTIDAIGGENTKLNFVEISSATEGEISDREINITPIEIPEEVPIPVEGGGVVEIIEPIAGGININFGTATVNTPDGFIQDIGAGYNAERGFGWVVSESAGDETPTPIDVFANARDRNTLFNDGQGGVFQENVRDSLIHLQYPTGLGNSDVAVTDSVAWEYALENGRYEVTVGVGDPDFFDSSHTINIEGVSAISGFVPTGSVENGFVPLDAQAFATSTVTVEVTDGRLTVDAIGGENTKINYISIVEANEL